MKKLFMITPEIRGKKIVILGTGQSSLLLFSVMLQNDIYVDSFLSTGGTELCDLKIMNKPIITEHDLPDNKESIAIIATGEEMLAEAEGLEKNGFSVFFDFNFTAYKGDSVLLQGESNLL
jgi:hypothetical protein